MLDAEKIAEQRGLIRDLTTVLEKRNSEIARLENIIREMDQCGLTRQAAEVLHPKSE